MKKQSSTTPTLNLPFGTRLGGLMVGLILLVLGVTAVRGEAISDIVVGYSATWRASMGGPDQVNAEIYNQFAGANNIAASSGSPHRQNVVGTMESAFDAYQQTDCGGMIGWMDSYDSRISDVLDYANYLGADQVSYIGDMIDNGAAAQAEQPGRYSCYEAQWFWMNVAAHESGGHNFGLDHGVGHSYPTTIMLHNYCGGSQPFYSNPNIWLNGVKLLGDGSCLGYLAQDGDAVYTLSTTAQGRSDAYDRRVWGSYRGAITYRWQFTNAPGAALAGTVITDEVSSAQAIVRGQGATFTGTALRLPGGTTGDTDADSIAAYVDLPDHMFSAMTNFTIEIWATPLSAQNWERVIDIGRTTEAGDGLGAAGEWTGMPGSPAPGYTSSYDDIMLSACIDTNLNSQRFEVKNDGTNYQTADSTLSTTAGQMHHYAITFADTASGGTVAWYRDGALVNTLNVTFHAAQLEDVNNWLGRSQWSSDSLANMDYYDVRIQNLALTAGQVAANYLIGPNDKVVTLWASDAWGSSAFVSGAWEFGQSTPDAYHDYKSGTLRLLSPWTTTDSTFPGRSLTITGGNITGLYLAGKNAKTTMINDLRLNGATIHSYGDNGSAQTLAGNITVAPWAVNQMRGEWGPMTISANISGLGIMEYTENAITLTGNNTNYTGATWIGDGRSSTLNISSEANLGGNPPWFGGDWLTLNRGILNSTATMTIDDANRGVRIGPSGGFLNPAAGTTLTIATPISSPAAGNTLQTAPLDSNPIEGILFVNGPGTVELTSPNNSHNAEMQILQGELRLSGNGRINNGDHWMPVTVNGLFTDNSSLDQTLRGTISGNGSIVKNNTSTLNLNGTNTFSGSVVVNGGTLYANPGDAPNNRALSYASSITVNNGGTLKAGANGLFGWDGTQVKPITVNAGGTLAMDAAGNNVNVGTVTLNGGMLAGYANTNGWGSWNFGRAAANNPGSGKLVATDNSTVTAPNLMFHDAAYIDVASGKTLTISGSLDDAANEGVCSLIKSNGTGTLVLSGANTYSGGTMVNAGTLLVNGSIGSGAVTVASGGAIGGSGTIAGAITMSSGATLSPGNVGIGTLIVGNSVTLQSGSTSYLEINKATGVNDKLIVAGALTYGGTLTVVNLGGTLASGDTFTLFQAGSYSGSFSTLNLPSLPSGLTWNFNSASGVLSISGSVLSTPTGLVSIPGNAQVGLIWNVSSNATSYNVKRATTSGGPYTIIGSPTTASYTDTAVVNGTTYYYVVSAVNAGGESANSAQVSATPQPVIPPTPTGLAAVSGNGQATLSWSASSGATSYNVKRSATSGGPYSTVGSPTGTSYTDTGLVNGTTYYYVVSAVNGGGESGNTAEVNVIPTDLPVWWKFDEGSGTVASDSSGSSDNATLQSGATWISGILSNAVNLDGSANGYAVAPAGLVSTLNDFTISTWVLVNTNAMWARIFDFGSGTDVNMFLTPMSGANTLRYAITTAGGGGEQQINSTTVLSPGIWHHVAVTLTNTTGILYVDGVSVGTNSSMTLKPSSLGSTTQNYIGKSQYADPNLMGSVDDFRIYNRSLSAAEVATLASAGLPSPWADADIGTVGLAGTAVYTNGTYTIQAAGADINGTVDAFRFVYQNATTDCSNTVRVVTVPNTGASAKAGVMIRESLSANAREAGIWLTPANGLVFTTRSSTGGTTSSTTSTGKSAPYWLRIQRVGNSFRAYYSANGTTWTQLGSSKNINMSSSTYIGMGVESGATNTLNTATMDNTITVP